MERRQVVESTRRTPVRPSAVNTVEVIFEATAHILQVEGLARLTTNRIAQQAGVSIGSLYAYFSNKESILLAMGRRELGMLRERVVAALEREDDETPPLRRVIRALIAGYSARDKARRLLMEALVAGGHSQEIAHSMEIATASLASDHRGLFPGQPAPLDLFVLTRAIDSVIRLATYERASFLQMQGFEDSLVRLVEGYFLAQEHG